MPYIDKPGQYDAIQWTGDNQAAVETAFNAWANVISVSVEADQSLTIRHEGAGGDRIVGIPLNDWAVSGPTWQGDPPTWPTIQTWTATAFAARFQQVA